MIFMRIGSICAGIMCGAGVAARISEIGVSIPFVLGVWVISGAAVSLVLEAMDEHRMREFRRKKGCGALSEDFAKLPEEERREFF